MARSSPQYFIVGMLIAALLGGAVSLIFGMRFSIAFGAALAALIANGVIAARLDADE
jgi:hypothetical protein